jgi:2-amino-4-hydroxy-6-hydroxymethyldihydropteridine diphosphokinase
MYRLTPGQSKWAMLSKTDNRIFIGLGSNLDDSPYNLTKAVQLLQECFRTNIFISSMYFSEPVEVLSQPWFFNQVAYFEDNELTPTMVLKELKAIEQSMGRLPSYRYGPRLIDLDLLLFKNWVFESESLTVPHSKIEERLFVLAPLVELDPVLIHPRSNLSIQQILVKNSPKFSRCEKISPKVSENQS